MISHAVHPPAIRRPAPKTTAPIALQVGDQVTINGVFYTVAATLVPVTGQPTPTPTPTPTPGPVVPTITGIRNLVTGQLVTSAVAGTSLRLEGTNLGTDGRLQLAGRIVANPTAWNPNGVSFFTPDPGALPATGAWDLYWSVNGSWARETSSSVFTLLPAGQPTPTPTPTPIPFPTGAAPQVRGLVTPEGPPPDHLLVGARYFVIGDSFGPAPGMVWVNGSPATVIEWTSNRVTILSPVNLAASANTQDYRLWISMRRADGVVVATLVR